MGAAVVLHKGVALVVKALLAHLTVNAIANRAPPFERSLQSKLFDRGHRTVESHPGHDLGVREVLTFAPYLPDAVIGLLPDALQMSNEPAFQRPAGFFRCQTGSAA